MFVDLLKLDRQCQMPNLLRAKWKSLHGYDPLRSARRVPVGFLMVFISGVFLFPASLILFLDSILDWFFAAGIGLIFLIVLLYTLSIMTKQRRFADALEKLGAAINPAFLGVNELRLYRWDELEEMAEKKMRKQILSLLLAEGQYAKAVTKQESRTRQEELQTEIARLRQELKDAHAALLAFKLVAEKWDQYFAAVEQELAGAEPAAAATA